MSRSLGGTFPPTDNYIQDLPMCMLFPEQPTPLVPTPCVRAAEEKLTLEKELVWQGLLQQLLHRSNPWSVGLL